MAKKHSTNPQLIKKPEGMSTYKTLSDMQMASLHGISRKYIESNNKFVNTIAELVQSITVQYNQNIASSTPERLVNSVKERVIELQKQSARNEGSGTNIITGIKGVLDTSKDMDIFRELYPLATPMFELFYEYEMIHDMIPEAAKCFDILKNSILSADNFSKKYLIPRYDSYLMTNDISVGDINQKHMLLIDQIVNEYDLNDRFDKYIKMAMMYGGKPVMILPIDNVFRKSAERILRSESYNEVKTIFKNSYNSGKKITIEQVLNVSDSTVNSTTSFEQYVDNAIELYDNVFTYEAGMIDTSIMNQSEKNNFNIGVSNKRNFIKKVKNKANKNTVITEIASKISDIVNTKVHFSITPEPISLRTVGKIASQLKTYRKSSTQYDNSIAMEAGLSDSDILDIDTEIICRMMDGAQYSLQTENTESRIYREECGDIMSYESAIITERFNRENPFDTATISKHTTGSVIIPLSPDTVVPISVYGEHIGYYVIERTGTDDLGSGVASLLGYKPTKSSYALGITGASYAGTGTGGAGVIIQDMIDVPMNSRDNLRRIDILRSMFAQAVAERIGNPDIVDDKAFNSILYSLIKDDYISKRDIRITYVPSHMMVYFAHDIDLSTGIGSSVFKNGLFFAHAYISAFVINMMIGLSKTADREQINLEVGISGRYEAMVQKVMRAMETKRPAMDSISNVDTIMKNIGQFQRNISLRRSGTPLIELETIPGQHELDMENSFMQFALQSFVNSFYVPHSAINILEETEYSRSITLQHALFLDHVVSIQTWYQKCNSKFVRILIRNRHPHLIFNAKNTSAIGTDEGTVKSAQDLINLQKVFLDLPSPEGLNIASLNEQVNNVTNFSDQILDMLVPPEEPQESQEALKLQIKLKLFKKYLKNIPFDEYEKMVEDATSIIRSKELKIGHAIGAMDTSSSDTGMGMGETMDSFGENPGSGDGDMDMDMGIEDF